MIQKTSRLVMIATLLILVLAPQVQGEDRLLDDSWFLLTLGDARLGHVHSLVRETTWKGRTVIESTTETMMTLNRMGLAMTIGSRATYRDDEKGEPVSFISEMTMSSMVTVTEGTVSGRRIAITQTVGGKKDKREIKLDEETIFPSVKFQARTLEELEKGKNLNLRVFVPDFLTVVHMTVMGAGRETISVMGHDMSALKTVTTMELMPNAPSTEWIDEKGNVLQYEMPLMGTMVRGIKVSREEALSTDKKAASMDVFTDLLIKPDRELSNPHKLDAISMNLTFTRGTPPSDFPEDGRQTVLSRTKNSLTLTILRQKLPDGVTPALANPDSDSIMSEFLAPSPFIQSDDPAIQDRARKIIDNETDPVAAAKKIIPWVYKNISKKNLSVGFASASEVFNDMTGDCSEHSVLAVALLRAVGIPARTCIGLMYSPQLKAFGYHMWCDVYAGKWIQMDPTFNQSPVDPSHILISRGNMDGQQLMAASATVNDMAAGVTIQILETR